MVFKTVVATSKGLVKYSKAVAEFSRIIQYVVVQMHSFGKPVKCSCSQYEDDTEHDDGPKRAKPVRQYI
jgi:hypothetical protein